MEAYMYQNPTFFTCHNFLGDGNCLLHAVSLALWGIEDDDLILRTALYRLLKEDTDRRNYLRWQRERLRLDAAIPDSGLVYNTTVS